MRIYLSCLLLGIFFFTTHGYSTDLKNYKKGNPGANLSPTSCSMAGTYSIGTGGNFPSIKRAVDSLKVRGITGNIIFELQANYTSSGETYPIIFPSKINIPCFTSNYTLTLRPASNATNLQITGAIDNNGLIRLDTCDYLTIDGRPGGTGSTSQLSIINNSGTTVLFRSSSNNKLRYVKCVTFKLGSTTSPGNILFISNTNFGSNNNLIENCDISLAAGSGPTSLIFCGDTNSGANVNDSIVNCNLHEFAYWAISLSDSARQWKIIGNSFYQQTPYVPMGVVGGDAVIKIGENYDAVGHVIDNNYFGGTGPQCTGSPLQVNFDGFDFAFIRGFGRVAITNNYFRRINLSGNTDISLINMGIGNTSPTHPAYGTVSNNQFGGPDPADSINIRHNYSSPNSNHNSWVGFINIDWGSVETVHNEFNRIRFWASDTTFRLDVTMIQGSYSVRDNIIGNPNIYNSIINSTNGTMLMIYKGHVVNNIISNIINTSTAHINGYTPLIRGISTTSDSIYNNKIFRITANSSIGCPSCQYFTEIIAITAGLAAGNNPNHIVGNTIHSLINNGEGGDIIAIQSNGAQVSKNLVHSLLITKPTNTYSKITGINGTSDSVTNNMIRLGLDSAGNSMTLPVIINGINGGQYILHNSVAIMGNNISGTASRNSVCFSSYANPLNTWANIRNNIFYNSRSNQLPASNNRHYCLSLKAITDQSNYNLFFNNGTGAFFGSISSNSYLTFAVWKTGTGKDINSIYGDPIFINPSGNYNQIDLHLANGTIAEAAGIAGSTVSKDYDNETRSILTPVDIGADAANFNSCPVAQAGNDTTICNGNSVQIGVQAMPNFNYNWTSNPVGFTSTIANPVVSPTVTTAYYLSLTNASLTCTSRDTIIVSISTATTPTITINTTATTICSNTPVTFTSTVTNGGSTPVYQWQINSVNAGTNSPTFTSSSLLNGDQVKCILTSNAVCVSSTTAISNTITMVVNASAPASVNISTPNTSNCTGTAVTFTATPVNGGAAPAYQWQVNGVNTGTNSNTFTTSTLTNNAQVKVILTSSLSCALPTTATSNIITMTVNPLPIANAGNDVNICIGGSTQLLASGGTTYSWSPVTGLSNPNIVNPVASPAATTTYTVTVSNGINCSSNDAVVVSVGPPATPTVSISTANNNICSGNAATFTAVATNGGASPTYQWQVNGINAGTNSNTFTSTSLTNNSQVKVILTSNSYCVTTPTATSNIITMTVDQLATPLVSLNNRVFTVTNPDAAATYTWQLKTNNVWGNVVPAATGITYTAPAGGEYRVKAVKAGCTDYSTSLVTNRNVNILNHPFGIYLYPNPNNGILNIDSIRISQKWHTLDIIDAKGRLVLTFDIKNRSSVSLDISILRAGTYFAQLKKIDGVYYTVEFVKL